ncbi:MAG: hypothetical protein DRQ48_09900 [Gammaproteobacteria bacterium]|nr:MAG: hypothetical protein DRQ48_09900 [Gammaproteobacteria bacterium]
MKLSIIIEDQNVVVDGYGISPITLAPPNNTRALQWDTDAGEIEYSTGGVNEIITVLPQWAIDAEQLHAIELAKMHSDTIVDLQPIYDFEATLATIDVSTLLTQDFTHIKIAAYKTIEDFRTVGILIEDMRNLGGNGSAVASMRSLHIEADKLNIPVIGMVMLADSVKQAQWLSILDTELMIDRGDLQNGTYVARLPQPLSAQNTIDQAIEADKRDVINRLLQIAYIQVELIDQLLAQSTIQSTDFTTPIRQEFADLKVIVERLK